MSKFDSQRQPSSHNDEFGPTDKPYFRPPNFKIEAQRYKQDCRKKALEAAMVFIPKATDAGEIKKFADIFYKWLIDIPE